MQCLEAEKTKRKRKSSFKNKPFSPPQRNPRKPNPITPSKLLNPPQNCHQPPSKHQNCWYPCQPNPNPIPPPQDLHSEIEKWERKQIHHPSAARFRQPKAKKVERESVRWDCEKEKEKESQIWKRKKKIWGRKRVRWDWEKEKRWESKNLLITVDVNTVCVEGLDWSF